MGRHSQEINGEELIQSMSLINPSYNKSNDIINAKGRCNLLGQKIFSCGIRYIKWDEEKQELTSTIHGNTLKKLFGATGNSLYENIKEAIEPTKKSRKTGKKEPSLMDWRITYINNEDRSIYSLNCITDASFEDGVLTITYNKKLKNSLIGLQSNYTMLNAIEQFSLTSLYSFKLYEISKQKLDFMRAVNKTNGAVEWEVSIAELKFALNVIDQHANPEIERIFKKAPVDYMKVEEALEKDPAINKYKNFANFKKNVIDIAVNEVNSNTSMDISYEIIRGGRGGKALGISFVFNDKKSTQKKAEVKRKHSESEKDAVIDMMLEIFDVKVGISGLKKIAEAADYDEDVIKKAYMISRQQKKIDNFVGWMIAAIKEGYEESVHVINSTSAFTNFEQRKYDFDLELLNEN